MNTLYTVCIVLFFVTIAQTQSSTCDNPLYSSSSLSSGGNCYKSVCLRQTLTSPAPKPQTSICPDIATGAPSCCSQAQYDALANQFKNAQAAIQQSADESAAMQANWGEYKDAMFQDFEAQLDAITYLSDDQKQQLKDAVLGAADTLIKSIGSDVAACSSALLKYLAGFVCLSCRADYDTYITTSRNGVITYLLDQQTCDGLASSCVPFYDHLSDYFTALTNAFKNFIPTTPSTTGSPLDDIGFNPCGNSTCRDYICNNLASGFSVGSVSGGSLPGTGGFKRDVESTIKFFTSLGKVSPATVKRQSSSQSTNQYTSNGYPAYSNGDKSGMDTSVQGPASSSSVLISWVSYFTS